MRNLLLLSFFLLIVFSCGRKGPTSIITSDTTYENYASDPYIGQLYRIKYPSSGGQLDSFPDCELKLRVLGPDSALEMHITVPDTNISYFHSLRINAHVLNNGANTYYCHDTISGEWMELKLPVTNDSAFCEYGTITTGEFQLYFLGEK